MNRVIEYLIQRKSSYFFGLPALLRRLSPTPQADMMLADLARFCRAHGTCFGKTERDTYVLIGRKQVFDRLTEHLHLPPERLAELYFMYRPLEKDDE